MTVGLRVKAACYTSCRMLGYFLLRYVRLMLTLAL